MQRLFYAPGHARGRSLKKRVLKPRFGYAKDAAR